MSRGRSGHDCTRVAPEDGWRLFRTAGPRLVGCAGEVSDAIVSDRELTDRAAATLDPHRGPGDRHLGGVAACLSSNLDVGVDVDTASDTGFCAERAAIAAMVAAGEYRIAEIVAVRRDEQSRLYVSPPRGCSRELIRQIDPANLETEVVLDDDRRRRLCELLPEHAWPEPLEP